MVELLLTLGLIGLVVTLLIVNADAFLQGLGPPPLKETFKTAVREARFQASFTKRPVYLRYDAEEAKFLISGESGNTIDAIDTELDADTVEVVFYELQPGTGTDFPSPRRTQREKTDALTFHPDRSSTPFEAELSVGRNESTHRYDAFSSIELVQN